MTRLMRASGLIIAAAIGFAAALHAGMSGSKTRSEAAEAPPSVCCIYLIF